jgi:tetratricopeptide (TPR) repeat protein
MNHLAVAAKGGIDGALADDNLRAYRVLDSARSRLGPGLIFTDFLLLSHNHSLEVGTYWFNAALNRNLDPGQAHWAGIVTNIDYQHYLAERFPRAQWVWVDQDQPGEDGGLTVGIVPIDGGNQAVFQKWLEAHEIFHGLSVQAENILNQKDLYHQAALGLSSHASFMGSDPFLESCYDEWTAQYHYGTGYETNIAAIQRALQKGYPTAPLYCKLGNFYWAEGRLTEAREAYAMAIKQKPNDTVAAQAQQYMDELLSKKPPP